MVLDKILKDMDFKPNKTLDFKKVEVSDISYDSRKVIKDNIFVCIKGYDFDSHDFAMDAYNNGARVFVVMRDLELPDDSIQIRVDDTRKALSKLSANFFNNPSKKIKIIGVTGTKGKTTTAQFLNHVLNEGGINTGIIGTNGIEYNNKFVDTVNTTPESYELQKNISDMVNDGVEYIVLEYSSSAPFLHRTDDVEIDIGIFTNISIDHIGSREHPDFQNYLDSKCELVRNAKHSIINYDDEHSDYVISQSSGSVELFSIDKHSDNMAKNIDFLRDKHMLGVDFDYVGRDYSKKFYLNMPGNFNVYNALAVITCANYLDIDKEIIYKTLKNTFVEGRMEIIDKDVPYTLINDYAHNRVSMENALSTITKYEHNRIICVFGSQGGRSEVRRKDLAEVASKYADICILTSENPCYEDPNKIIDEIESYFTNDKVEIIKITDRFEAVKKGVDIAEKGDIVIFTGKGHEDYEIVKGKRLPYKETEVIKKYVEERIEREKNE